MSAESLILFGGRALSVTLPACEAGAETGARHVLTLAESLVEVAGAAREVAVLGDGASAPRLCGLLCAIEVMGSLCVAIAEEAVTDAAPRAGRGRE